MRDREDDVSRSYWLPDNFKVIEANFREKSARLFNGIEAIDRRWKAGNRMRVLPGGEGEDKSAGGPGHTIDLPEMEPRVVPKIKSVHRISPIEMHIRIRNPVTASKLHFHSTPSDGTPVAALEHPDHIRRNVDACHESSRHQLSCPQQRSAVPKTDFEYSSARFRREQLKRPFIDGQCLRGHHPEEQPTQKPAGIGRLPRYELRAAQLSALRAGQ